MPTCASINCVNRQTKGCGKTFTQKKLKRKTTRCQSNDTISLEDFPVEVAPSTLTSIDHSYFVQGSPRFLKRKLNTAVERINYVKKRLLYSQQRSRRLKRKVDSLESVVEAWKHRRLISESCANMLQKSFTGVPLKIMKRIVNRKSNKITRKSYPEMLRSFALTLQFYSTKAYNYVRKTFNLALPHPSSIRRWYSIINGETGFTEEAFAALKLRVQDEKSKASEVICSLMIDEMAIKKHIEWNGKKLVGFVDIGANIDDDTTPVASEALVFMLVAINSNWKVPIGHFLIAGMSGVERVNLVKQFLSKLSDINVNTVSLTCDGPSCHFAMMNELGAVLKPPNIMPFFDHPTEEGKKVYVIFDVCHMIKLLRNTLATGGILKDGDGGIIRWNYIQELHKLQEHEGLRLGNKLKSVHMMWEKQKMKVNLAEQTLSSSVADAIDFCSTVLKLNEFQGSEPTINFIRTFDRLFDILNSRNPLANNYKAPMRLSNERFILPYLNKTYEYKANITDSTGRLMYNTSRKTPFIGFMCAIQSVIALYQRLVSTQPTPLKYLLTYKLSQDHIELFFGAVRASLSCNNNPTVCQFIASYKRLLIRHEIQANAGNCTIQDQTRILHLTKDCITINSQQRDVLNMSIIRRYDITEQSSSKDEYDYLNVPDFSDLSEYKQHAVAYIAGYVVRMVRKRLHCTECLFAQLAKMRVFRIMRTTHFFKSRIEED